MTALLQTRALCAFYGRAQALFDVDLEVEAGEIVALVGRNGAGKSTTMKAIIGLAPSAKGRIALRGATISGRSADRVARAGIGYVPEDRQVFPEHSVEDNLLIGAKPGADGRTDWTLARVWQVFPILAGMKGRMAGRLSGGEQQLLTIARTLMGNPDVLLLDEPSEGLAPVIVDRIGELVRELRDMGTTLIVAEQNLHFCLDITSHAVVIDKGEVVYTGTVAALSADGAVMRKYLAV